MTHPKAPHPQIKVPALKEPLRVDKFLSQQFPLATRAYWREHLSREILIDGKLAKKGQLLKGGEILTLRDLPPEIPQTPQANPLIKLDILHQDPDYLAVDKPTGIPCHPLKREETQTMVNGLLAQFPEQAEVEPGSREAGLLQRLDNATSGVLLFARNLEAKSRYFQLNREGKILKEYQAWVQGRVSQGGVVATPIAHHPKNKKKMTLPRDENEVKKLKARPARTQFEVLQSGESYSLLRIGIARGCRHQIRLHLASLGHPVVGDELYGKASSATPTGRLLLHAHCINFRHPFTGKLLTLASPLPSDFQPQK